MLCYRCGSHVPDTSETCPTCGQKSDAASRQAGSRRRAEDAPYKPGDVVALRYAVREVIGSGPLGAVFKAHDQDMDVEVALKVVHSRLLQAPDERAQFSQVLRNGRKLTHPHLMRVYEEGLDGDSPYYTMQLLGGTTLRKLMEAYAQRGQRFSLPELEPLVAQLASALDDAHRLGPHADLKPENILILPDLVKVTDCGLGLALPRLPFIQAQRYFRVDGYFAPEFVSGGEFDGRMDIYALAAIVGEMLTGLLPVNGVPPELGQKFPELPPAFEALYRRALNPNPLARPQTAGEFHREFAAIAGRAPAPARPVAVAAPPVPAPAPVAVREPAPALGPLAGRVPTAPAPVSGSLAGRVPTAPAPTPAAASIAGRVPTGAGAASRPRSRPEASGAHAALVPAGGQGPKPPPPVPTDQLPAVRVATGASGVRPALRQEPPPDATQPVSAEELLRLTSPSPPPPQEEPPPVDATQPMDAEMLAKMMSQRHAAVQESAPRKEVTASKSGPRASPVGVAAPSSAGAAKPSRPMPWLMLLAVAGLVTGSLGGYFVLRGKQQPPGASEATPNAAAPAAAAATGEGCPSGMRLIPGGPFSMGTLPDDHTKGFDERPLSKVELPAYCIDEYEFPNTPGTAPRVDVSFAEAQQACEAAHKRLCTEEEWEKACKGPSSQRFPYGNAFDANRCNTEDAFGDDRALAASGKFDKCRSGYGVADLSGNVAEWTSTRYSNNTDMTQKGGSFDRPDYAARCSARKNRAPEDRSATVGFRCCANP